MSESRYDSRARNLRGARRKGLCWYKYINESCCMMVIHSTTRSPSSHLGFCFRSSGGKRDRSNERDLRPNTVMVQLHIDNEKCRYFLVAWSRKRTRDFLWLYICALSSLKWFSCSRDVAFYCSPLILAAIFRVPRAKWQESWLEKNATDIQRRIHKLMIIDRTADSWNIAIVYIYKVNATLRFFLCIYQSIYIMICGRKRRSYTRARSAIVVARRAKYIRARVRTPWFRNFLTVRQHVFTHAHADSDRDIIDDVFN